MKIDDSIKKLAGLSNGQPVIRTEKNSVTDSIGDNFSQTVHISALSSQLKALEEKFPLGNTFNSNKVEDIKLAIASGNFKIDSSKVADGLLDAVRDLLQSPTKD